ncbi:MAG TPA: hypothetical protein VMS31_02795 [Pyrinomonadaceae bacterium]|nr:hypothetical protein [Pyrinomonadaceae bacterium]
MPEQLLLASLQDAKAFAPCSGGLRTTGYYLAARRADAVETQPIILVKATQFYAFGG